MSLLNSASLVVTPNAYKEGTLYSVIPNTTLGDMTVVRATTATRVNSAGLIELVANNIPRLDYSNGTCPSLLVEPQRTNSVTYSEKFDDASWLLTGATLTGGILSPSGINNAWTLSNTAPSGIIQKAVSLSGTRTLTLYAKQGTHRYIYMGGYGGVDSYANFDLLNGVVSNGANATIESVGNGWYRCTCHSISGTTGGVQIFPSNNAVGNSTTNGSIYIWGAQLEAGSYPTSYIPTTAAAVTRNADVISKTGISSLIGQTEGTMFVDFVYNGNYGSATNTAMPISLDDASGNNEGYIFLNGITNTAFAQFVVGGSFTCNITGLVMNVGTRYKMAFAYKQNDFAFYINGVLQGVDTSGNIAALSNVRLCNYIGLNYIHDNLNSAVLFPTRLTNAELISLTTI